MKSLHTFFRSVHVPRPFLPARYWLLLMLGAAFLPSASYAESTLNSGGTEITALPCTITTPGNYFLKLNFSGSFANLTGAITVSASGVTIDMNGHTITNTSAVATTSASGIRCNNDMSNLTVRNGTFIGFQTGVLVLTSSTASTFYSSTCPSYGHLIENVTCLKSTYCAIRLSGVGSRILRCRAILTGGNSSQNMYESFKLWGANNTIEDCDVCGKSDPDSTGFPTYGITVSMASDNFVINNRVVGVDIGIRTSSNGNYKYRDNITSGVTTAWSGGIDAGNNFN